MDSVLRQTFVNFELIALDDGSSDRTLEILRLFESIDPRVRIISRENRGLVASLNEMIDLARGKYIARMDADDVCFPTRFEQQVMFLEMHQDHVAIGAQACHINEKDQIIGPIRLSTDHEDIDREHLQGYCSIVHPLAMIRKEALKQAGSYRQDFPQGQDLDLWLRIAEIGKIANLPNVLLYFRLHPMSVSGTAVARQSASARRACEEAWKRRGIEGTFKAVEHWRPDGTRRSQHKFALQYGWVAWQHGNRATWRTYAIRSLVIAPFSLDSWKLLIFGWLLKNERHDRNISNI